MKILLIVGIMFALAAGSSLASSIWLDLGKSNDADGKETPEEQSLQVPTTNNDPTISKDLTSSKDPATSRKAPTASKDPQNSKVLSGRTGKVPNPEGTPPSEKYGQGSIGSGLLATFSQHIPLYLTPLKMSPGELKQFAGHSFQFIKAKCPSVPADKLDGLNKYVAKLISKEEPKQDISALVSGMIKSLSQCSKTMVTKSKSPPPASDGGAQRSFWGRYFDSFHSAKTTAKSTDETGSTAKTIVVEDGTEFIVTSPPQTGFFVPYIKTVFWTDSSDSNSQPSWNPFRWFGNVFHSIKNFTLRFFGGPTTTTSAEAPPRQKRSITYVEETPASQQETERKEKERMEDMIAKLQSNPMSGQDAFLHFFENLCRIYCKTCPHDFEVRTRNFKAAAKALMAFIQEEDKSGSDLAAEHYLDNAFLQALNDC